MVDFSTYQPPGVYVEEEVAPTVTVVGVTPSVVALVGPSIGYREFTEAVTLVGTGPQTLTQKGINVSSLAVVGENGTVYPSSAYSTTVSAGADGNIAVPTDNTTTIARNGAGIPDGAFVYVTYRYTDATYTEPTRLTDFDDIVDAYGSPLDLASNAILSPLSFAAKVARENGSRDLVLVSTPNAVVTRADLTAAYAKLESIYDVDIVVPLSVGVTGTPGEPGDTALIGQDLKAYVESSSNVNGLLKTGFYGLEATATVDPLTTVASFRSKRVVFAGAPRKLSYFNGQTNSTMDVAPYYLAAALAGLAAGQGSQVPLTKKVIRGFSGVPASVLSAMTVTSKNSLSAGGVLVTEVTRSGSLTVRHGTTTDRTNTQTRELSLVRSKDDLINLIQDTFEQSSLIGDFIDGTTNVRVQGVVTGCLEAAVRYQLIIGYSGVKVRQRQGDPQVIEVKFQYEPAYPLNYIVVSFSINTVTGETTALDLAA